MSRAARALAASLLAALALTLDPLPAGAVYQCGGQRDTCPCSAYNPYPCCDNGGNCTWWAWHSACCNWDLGLPGWGNANQWAGNARNNGNYRVLGVPVMGSIATSTRGTFGHVAYVIGIGNGTVTVSEENCCGSCNYGMRHRTYSTDYFNSGFIVPASRCECSPGQSQSQGCGLCGSQSRRCGADCRWGGWSGCGGQGVCSPGQSQSQACGNCGSQSRGCAGNCQWGGWSACGGQGACSPGQQQSEACGNCGSRGRVCAASCRWNEWGTCADQGSCAPGETETEGCGNCGHRARTCGTSCRFSEWSACAGEGVCAPRARELRACGNCGEEARACNERCQWEPYEACRGQGACAPGEGQTRPCGNCGVQRRTCDSSCGFSEWGACKGEGECPAGRVETRACGTCGAQVRTCSAECRWRGFGECAERKDGCSAGATATGARGAEQHAPSSDARMLYDAARPGDGGATTPPAARSRSR